jgi:hypothetical protein
MPLACRRGAEDGKVLCKAQATADIPQSHMTKYSANPRGVKPPPCSPNEETYENCENHSCNCDHCGIAYAT